MIVVEFRETITFFLITCAKPSASNHESTS